MTTVAANRFAMSADSRVSHGQAHFNSSKIWRGEDGSIVGFSGSMSDGKKFCEWFISDQAEDFEATSEDGFDALVLYADGKLEHWDKDMCPIEITSDFYSIGSGQMAALAAMHMGAPTELAVQVAIMCDVHSGGPVMTVHRELPHDVDNR
jgi:ATP-dependent protease HslVU (ClpYQ) peptidase subunit